MKNRWSRKLAEELQKLHARPEERVSGGRNREAEFAWKTSRRGGMNIAGSAAPRQIDDDTQARRSPVLGTDPSAEDLDIAPHDPEPDAEMSVLRASRVALREMTIEKICQVCRRHARTFILDHEAA